MAKEYITFSCGHDGCVTVFGRSRDRERKLDYFREQGICPACWEKKRQEERAKAAAEAEEHAEKEGLPALEGSEKQIAWAMTIRDDFYKFANDHLPQLMEEMKVTPEVSRAIDIWVEGTLSVTSAKEWIDDRDYTSSRYLDARGVSEIFFRLGDYCCDAYGAGCDKEEEACAHILPSLSKNETLQLMKQLLHGKRPKAIKIETDREKEEKAENDVLCTLAPETARNNVPAKIMIEEDNGASRLSVKTPERNESVINTLRLLRLEFSDGVWVRKYAPGFDRLDDRVCEIAASLFKAGYIVILPRQELIQRVIDGDYKPYNPRRIGASDGKFHISWSRSGDYYDNAKRIPGAKWISSAGAIAVAKENYEYILDFAERYGFEILQPALDLVEEAKKNRLGVTVSEKIAEPEKLKASGKKRPDLEPEQSGIDESLLDSDEKQ